ncbi:MAG: WYL domain-containing protein [Hydrogenophilaceae bacterium]|nr:WYL domain-containing protein [Hydrogenophilaceae bacterium]
MIPKEKMMLDLKWATLQRLKFIEIMSWYAGVVTRSDLARAFGMSDPAATKDIKLYNELAPGNLIYSQAVFGFVPTGHFSPAFANLEPAAVLPVLAANLATMGGPYGDTRIYGLALESLPLPSRLPGRQVLAQITRAMRGQKKLKVSYRSLSGRDSQDQRILEPHTLVDTGNRWHVRAYSEATCDFRDFVLSRFIEAECLDEYAVSSVEYDEDWVETLPLKLGPHRLLSAKKRENLLIDYGAVNGVIEIEARRALIGYVLQRLNVDTSLAGTKNPDAYPLMLLNREEIEPFASWVFERQ